MGGQPLHRHSDGRIVAWGAPAHSIDLTLVETRAFVGVAQDIVGGLRFLETLFGIPVTGIQVWMELLGELVIGLTDITRGGRLRNTKNRIRITGHITAPKLHRSYVIWGVTTKIERCTPCELQISPA